MTIMPSPLYYLLASSEGYQSSNVAKYLRINTGLWQSDTAVNTEANLVLTLQNYGSNVDTVLFGDRNIQWQKEVATRQLTSSNG